MSEQLIETRSGAAGEIMSALQFQEELQRVARFARNRPVENPLAAVVQTIKDAPHFTQSRLLGRILTALTYDRGEFRRAEASAPQPRDDWIKAVAACEAAAAG